MNRPTMIRRTRRFGLAAGLFLLLGASLPTKCSPPRPEEPSAAASYVELVTVPGRVGDEPNQPQYYGLEMGPGVWRIEGVPSQDVDCGVDRLPEGVVPLIEGTVGPFFEVPDSSATIEFYCFNKVWEPHEGGVSVTPYDLRDDLN